MTHRAPLKYIGLIQAVMAAVIWGVLPVYFKALQSVAPLEVVAHRIIWSIPLLLLILWFRKNLTGLKQAWSDPKIRKFLFFSSIFIAINWLFYVWAVVENHVLAASLGYFVSPLLSVFLGGIFLKEKLNRKQWIAVAIAAIGVSILAIEAWQTLWISAVLATSWSAYALIRKIAPVGPIVGLSMETTFLFPFFGAFLLWVSFGGGGSTDGVHFGDDANITLLLLGGAVLTATPLLLFAAAVKKMNLGTIGLLQYIAPSLQFLIAVFIYNEPLSTSQIICFIVIWISLLIFSAETIWGKASKQAVATP